VFGHHPFSLQMWLENLWTNLRVDYHDHDPRMLDCLHDELEEFDEALDVLTREGLVRTDGFLPFLRAWEEARRCAWGALGQCEWLVPADGFVPAEQEREDLQKWPADLLQPREGLGHWRSVGEAIGRWQFRVGSRPEFDRDDIPAAELKAVRKQSAALTGAADRALRSRIRRAVSGAGKPWDGTKPVRLLARIYARYKEAEGVDRAVRAELRERPCSGPLLVLDQGSITFFGASMPLPEVNRSAGACLWVLVEHAGALWTARRLSRRHASPATPWT
jgi:hypothetical protein